MTNILIFTWFQTNYPALVSLMASTEHSIPGKDANPYHGEGPILTHTAMVLSHVPEGSSNDIKLAAILHDIGKPACQKISEDESRFSFTGHEFLSSFMAIDILTKFKNEVDNDINVGAILFAINFHSILHRSVKIHKDGYPFLPDSKASKLNRMFHSNLGLYDILFALSLADSKGRFSIDAVEIESKYKVLAEFIPYMGHRPAVEMSSPEAHFVVGLPGSGKTTKIETLMKNNPDLILLSVDDEIMRLAKYSDTYDSSWTSKRSKEAGQNMLLKMKELVKEGKSFIFDATNFSEKIRTRRLAAVSGRYRKIAHLQLAGEKFIIKTMKERTDKSLPIDKIHGMAKMFSYPNSIEFDEIYTTILGTK